MPFDGSGNYTPASAPSFPAITGQVINATYYNTVINDISTAFNNCLTRDGQGKPSAAINWNAQNLTNVATFAAVSASFTNALPVNSGGSGLTTTPSNGQLLIGNGTNYTLATLTAGTGMSISNGAGSITINNTGVTSVNASGGTTGLSFTGGPVTTTGTLTLTGTLAIANGGTGSTSAANARIALSAAASGANTDITSLSDAASLAGSGTINTTSIGYRGMPQNSQGSGYTLALTDSGKHVFISTGGITIPANGSVAFVVGSAVTIINNSASSQTIAITTDTLRLAGTTSTGSRTLAAWGVCTVIKVASTTWIITGNVL